jgi:hypothetical protein
LFKELKILIDLLVLITPNVTLIKLKYKFTIYIHYSYSLLMIYNLNSSYFYQNLIEIIETNKFIEKKFPTIINNIYKKEAHLLLFNIGAYPSNVGEFIN